MKNSSLISDIPKKKCRLETSFNENSDTCSFMHDGNDFFGLPHKVKYMFKKYKKITQLYGMFC